MSLGLLPISGRVLIHRDDLAEKTPNGMLYLPMNRKSADEARSVETVRGMVVCIADDCTRLVEGDRVVYRWFTGDELLVNDKRCVMLDEDQVLAIFNDDETLLYPLDNRVIIKQDPSPSMSEGGIALAEAYQDKPCFGTVREIGPGRLMEDEKTRFPINVERKDRVVMRKYAGNFVEVDEEELVILRDNELLAKVRED